METYINNFFDFVFIATGAMIVFLGLFAFWLKFVPYAFKQLFKKSKTEE